MKLDPGIHIAMHSILSLKPGVTPLPDTLFPCSTPTGATCERQDLATLRTGRVTYHYGQLTSFEGRHDHVVARSGLTPLWKPTGVPLFNIKYSLFSDSFALIIRRAKSSYYFFYRTFDRSYM